MTLDEITKEFEATILSAQPELKIIPQQYYEPNEQYLVTKFCAIIVLFGVWKFESEDFDTELEAAEAALDWVKERGE